MVTRVRAVGIVEHERCVLLIQRKKRGSVYWVFPGGGIEKGETGERAVVREVNEETSVVVESPTLWTSLLNDGEYGDSYFYRCVYVQGVPALSQKSPEYKRMATEEENEYYPQWVPLSELPKLRVFPEVIVQRYIREQKINDCS